MNILYITNMYPYKDYTYYGIHVKEQIDCIRRLHAVHDTIFFINGRVSKLNYLYSIIKANWLVMTGKTDVVHIHFGLSGLFLLFNPFVKVPTVLTLHGSDVNTNNVFTKFIVRIIISRCSKVIVMNKQMYEAVKPYAKSLEIIPCGIDLDFFKPGSKPVHQHLVLGFSGNPERIEKNYKLFSVVIEQLKQKGLSIEVVIFHGLSRQEVVEKLNYIDILLLTSDNEGSPQIIKEALACNTAIVSVPVGDVPAVLKGIHNCRVTRGHYPEEIVDKILDLVHQPGSGSDNSGRDRLKALSLDQEATAEKIFNTYNLVQR